MFLYISVATMSLKMKRAYLRLCLENLRKINWGSKGLMDSSVLYMRSNVTFIWFIRVFYSWLACGQIPILANSMANVIPMQCRFDHNQEPITCSLYVAVGDRKKAHWKKSTYIGKKRTGKNPYVYKRTRKKRTRKEAHYKSALG